MFRWSANQERIDCTSMHACLASIWGLRVRSAPRPEKPGEPPTKQCRIFNASLFSALLLVLLVLGAPALAAETFQELVQRGAKLYEEREYGEAAAAFLGAYEQKRVTRLLFNLGQCHRKLGHAKEALSYYEGYLKQVESISAEHRAEVDAYIEQMRTLIAVSTQMPKSEPPPSVARPTAQEKPLTKKPWFWAVIGTSAALVVGGVVVGVVLGTQKSGPPVLGEARF